MEHFIYITKGPWRSEGYGHSLHYFNPYISFWSCIKSPNSKQNEYENASWYRSG
ncbi:hypothetical protein E2C01_019334 [Portunus trituberculatus]|uniref:Uncharacterized protein n=1 Tax=Portunus trituberculatus TaxID=210409 RepID=A0A5B7DXB1_PORTR|nr:hypothetical protein [Portunus trituberculatus]